MSVVMHFVLSMQTHSANVSFQNNSIGCKFLSYLELLTHLQLVNYRQKTQRLNIWHITKTHIILGSTSSTTTSSTLRTMSIHHNRSIINISEFGVLSS